MMGDKTMSLMASPEDYRGGQSAVMRGWYEKKKRQSEAPERHGGDGVLLRYLEATQKIDLHLRA